jgi:hypothetical protein
MPYFGVGAATGLVVLLGGLLMRVFERSASSNFSYIWSGFWLIGITITTVGYGDIVPTTHIGRLICGLSAIFGMCVLSYAIDVVQTSFTIELSAEAQLAGTLLYQKKLDGRVKELAVVFIQRWWRLHLKRRQRQPRHQEVYKFMVHLSRFAGFISRFLKFEDLHLTNIADSMDRNSTREFKKTTKLFTSLKSSKEIVRVRQSSNLKLESYHFELANIRYAKFIRSIFNSFNPARQAPPLELDLLPPDDMKLLRRKVSLSKLAVSKTQAKKAMFHRLSLRHSNASSMSETEFPKQRVDFDSREVSH